MKKTVCIYCAAPATRWCDLVLGFDSAGGPLATLKTQFYRCDAPLCPAHAVFKGNIFFSGSKAVAGMESIDHCQGHAPDVGGLKPISADEAKQLRHRHRCLAGEPLRAITNPQLGLFTGLTA
ncbi:hypothetical protein BH10PSE16_BH10PSE16_01030 [soil metagenome]